MTTITALQDRIPHGHGLYVVITASRTWPDEHRMYDALTVAAQFCDPHFTTTRTGWPTTRTPPHRPAQRLTIVEGGASGGDRMAGRWAEHAYRSGWDIRHATRPARWRDPCRPSCPANHRRVSRNRDGRPDGNSTCPSAGFYRNEQMVHEAVDVTNSTGIPALLLAFVHNGSNGASHCLKVGIAAGLDYVEFKA